MNSQKDKININEVRNKQLLELEKMERLYTKGDVDQRRYYWNLLKYTLDEIIKVI